MTTEVFQQPYAEQYDAIYGDKDYERECDLLTQIFRRYGHAPVKTVLDLGCGTGNHSWPLARRGYTVTGVDRSPAMLARAKGKASVGTPAAAPELRQGDFQALDLQRQFDAVLMMFAVLGYQLTNHEVRAALEGARRHLLPGGLFVCDVWYGPAVLAIRPGERVKAIPAGDRMIVRSNSTTLDPYHHSAEVRYHVWQFGSSGLAGETVEAHTMRYFFPQELALFFELARLRVRHCCSVDDLERGPSEDTWNVLVVGEAI